MSATTRPPRPGEVDGREYHFLDERRLRAAVAAGDFLEWVEYSGNLYGTLRSEVEAKLAAGDDVILEIELIGARAVRTTMPEAISVFIAPPSMAELAERLRGRGTETDAAIAKRLRQGGDRGRGGRGVRPRRGERRRRARRRRGGRHHRSTTKGRLVDKPRIDELLPHADGSRYELVMIAAKRARQINNYYHSLGENTLGLEELTPPLITTRSTNLLTIAFEEIVDNKIDHENPE